MWMEIAVGAMLSVCAAEDWFERKIPAWCPVLCMGVGIMIRLAENTLGSADFWLGLLIGLIVLAIAAVSGEQIGRGDGLVLTACGICLGWKTTLSILFGGMLLFLITGVIGILLKRWTGRKALAFVPFLWGCFLIICLVGGS